MWNMLQIQKLIVNILIQTLIEFSRNIFEYKNNIILYCYVTNVLSFNNKIHNL